MPTQQGLEARYQSKYIRSQRATGRNIEHVDVSTGLAAKFRDANHILSSQQRNINQLLTASENALGIIRTHQQRSGIRQVEVMGPVTEQVKESFGSKMGYIQLTIKFLAEMLVASLTDNLEMKEEQNHLYRQFRRIAEHDNDINLIGEIREVSIEDLESEELVVNTQDNLEESDTDDSDSEAENTPVDHST